jgi:hypothetical protein
MVRPKLVVERYNMDIDDVCGSGRLLDEGKERKSVGRDAL